jgi:hypothetical protein
VICGDDLAQIFRIELCGQLRRANEVTVHYGELALDGPDMPAIFVRAGAVIGAVFSLAGPGVSRRAAMAARSFRRWPI